MSFYEFFSFFIQRVKDRSLVIRGCQVRSCSVEVKSVLPGGRQEPLPHHGLGGVVRQLEVVHAGVDAGVGAVGGVDFPHQSQSGVQIGQPA